MGTLWGWDTKGSRGWGHCGDGDVMGWGQPGNGDTVGMGRYGDDIQRDPRDTLRMGALWGWGCYGMGMLWDGDITRWGCYGDGDNVGMGTLWEWDTKGSWG